MRETCGISSLNNLRSFLDNLRYCLLLCLIKREIGCYYFSGNNYQILIVFFVLSASEEGFSKVKTRKIQTKIMMMITMTSLLTTRLGPPQNSQEHYEISTQPIVVYNRVLKTFFIGFSHNSICALPRKERQLWKSFQDCSIEKPYSEVTFTTRGG